MRKTRLLSLILAAVMLIPVGCSAPAEPATSTVDSSSAQVTEYAMWLADRLDAEIEGNDVNHKNGTVTLAVAENDDALGVDTTGL